MKRAEGNAVPFSPFTSEDLCVRGPKRRRSTQRRSRNKENDGSVSPSTPESCSTSLQSLIDVTPNCILSDVTNTASMSQVMKTQPKKPCKNVFKDSLDIAHQLNVSHQKPTRRHLSGGLTFLKNDKCQKTCFEDVFTSHNSNVTSTGCSRLFSDDLESPGTEQDNEFSEDIETSKICSGESTDDDIYSEDEFVEPSTDSVHDVFTESYNPTLNPFIVPREYNSLGAPSCQCEFCGALLWKDERANKNVTRGKFKFTLCCLNGKIILPPPPPTSPFLMSLYNDKEKCPAFLRNIRLYNSMFSMSSSGGSVDHSINNGRAPYVYRLNGQNHHVFGSLLPNNGKDPKFCQLYIYDTENEVGNRIRWVRDQQQVDTVVVQGLIDMLDETNELVKCFRTARDRFKDEDIIDLKIVLKVCRSESGRENNLVTSDEVAGIMVGDLDDNCGARDIIIECKQHGLKRISKIHPSLMALHYPILFPNGEDGFHDDISYVDNGSLKKTQREKVSMMEYYAYKLQVRPGQANTLRRGGRLFQQYVVDAFAAVEQARLWWFRQNQTTLRNELYHNICQSLKSGEESAANTGRGYILPAGFVGSKRYMQQNFQDALAVCRHIGHPDIFLTMTTNSMWDEIMKMMDFNPGCYKQNCPDIVARVFRLKLDQLLTDIKKKSFFGKCLGVMYVVEFQKRGLPHVHMLIWLEGAAKKNLAENVDKYVSAEIPDPSKDLAGYLAVKQFMMHGPCGQDFQKSPCMKDYKCIRHFPKKYCDKTTIDESGFPVYMRRKSKVTVHVRNAVLDNQMVVPYNRDLLVKYQCHINVEICCHARSLKYLFKYCLKGHDRATVEVKGTRKVAASDLENKPVDEIQAYFDGRYICGAEAAYRLFGFTIHYRSVSVHRLSFHLPGEKNVTFRADDDLAAVVHREKYKLSKLEAFFELNKNDSTAKGYTYDEIPRFYVWNDLLRKWSTRKRGFQLGRLAYSHHSSGEIWYLRLLLSKVRGPESYEALRTVNGTLYPTYKAACNAYGFLSDDKEWHEVLTQCSACGFPGQIRQLFVHIIVNCKVNDLLSLWSSHWEEMVDDLVYLRRRLSGNKTLMLNVKQQQFLALAEIDKLLRSIGKSLNKFPQLPQPPPAYLNQGSNNLIIEETNFDLEEMSKKQAELFVNLNVEQMDIYKEVLDSVMKNLGRFFFVYGSGGCGKTYIWKTLIYKLRSEGRIVLPVASSGIAATLLPGGRTAHSRFKIPIMLDEFSSCSIGHDSDIAHLIKRTDLIIWDEAPMQHRFSFECLDRSLRDLMKSVEIGRYYKPFGGITMLLGGDFRQVLPVIPRAPRGEIVCACITRSRLWSLCKVFLLRQNMRITKGGNALEAERMKAFAQWVLDIGDGKIGPPCNIDGENVEDEIEIPEEFCHYNGDDTISDMISNTFPNLEENFKDPQYLRQRAILTPTNHIVSQLNALIVKKIPGEMMSYFSVDEAEEFGGSDAERDLAFPSEHLNSLNVPGLPNHELKLKVGVMVMLIRNLNQTLGLCNGTRMMVTKCLKNCVQCEVLSGSFVGTRHFIPRMELSPTDSRLPFKLIRLQMPLQICYAMTINKSQGQSLDVVGLYLPKPVFSHGQLYVAISRVTSPEGLRIYIQTRSGRSTNITLNVVFKEVFYNLV